MPPAAKTPPVFSLLNLIRSPQPATLKIGSEPVGEGQMSLGFYTGIVTWLPSVPLVVEAPGFGSLRIPFTPAGGGECPLLVVQDALEKPLGGGEPKPVLKFITVTNAKDRPPHYADGLNLTTRETLTGDLGGKTVSLEKGKRTRISTANGFVLQMKDSPEVAVSPSEVPGGVLVIFYENLEAKIEFALTNDVLIRP
jgi:hypothetical protein